MFFVVVVLTMLCETDCEVKALFKGLTESLPTEVGQRPRMIAVHFRTIVRSDRKDLGFWIRVMV